jgi:hypothetical protein
MIPAIARQATSPVADAFPRASPRALATLVAAPDPDVLASPGGALGRAVIASFACIAMLAWPLAALLVLLTGLVMLVTLAGLVGPPTPDGAPSGPARDAPVRRWRVEPVA